MDFVRVCAVCERKSKREREGQRERERVTGIAVCLKSHS